jgi:hypothetical protein
VAVRRSTSTSGSSPSRQGTAGIGRGLRGSARGTGAGVISRAAKSVPNRDLGVTASAFHTDRLPPAGAGAIEWLDACGADH